MKEINRQRNADSHSHRKYLITDTDTDLELRTDSSSSSADHSTAATSNPGVLPEVKLNLIGIVSHQIKNQK